MPTNLDGITLALALTTGGAVIFAGLITGIVEVAKTLAAGVVSGREQLLAFILSGVFVVLAIASATSTGLLTLTLESGFAGFLAWYGIARIAMGIHDDTIGRADAGPQALGGAVATIALAVLGVLSVVLMVIALTL